MGKWGQCHLFPPFINVGVIISRLNPATNQEGDGNFQVPYKVNLVARGKAVTVIFFVGAPRRRAQWVPIRLFYLDGGSHSSFSPTSVHSTLGNYSALPRNRPWEVRPGQLNAGQVDQRDDGSNALRRRLNSGTHRASSVLSARACYVFFS